MGSDATRRPEFDPTALQVLRLTAAGMTTDEVADFLGISPPEARRHLHRAIVALQVSSKEEAVSLAIRLRLWHLPDE